MTLLTVSALIGLWQTGCTQTQVSGKSGYAREQLEFAAQKVVRRRVWFKDSACGERDGQTDETAGTYSLGKTVEVQNDWTLQAMDWTFDGKTEKGSIGSTPGLKTLRMAFGFGKDRNTMLEFISYERATSPNTKPSPVKSPAK